MYFIVCGERLDWGFIDQPPLIPAVAATMHRLFPGSLAMLRLLPALAHAATIVLAAATARQLGGGVWAQAIAALCVLTGGVFLGIGTTLSTGALEPREISRGKAAGLMRTARRCGAAAAGNRRWTRPGRASGIMARPRIGPGLAETPSLSRPDGSWRSPLGPACVRARAKNAENGLSLLPSPDSATRTFGFQIGEIEKDFLRAQ